MQSNILVLTVFSEKALKQIKVRGSFKRIILICKDNLDPSYCRGYVEKLVNGSIFVSTVKFSFDFMSVVYDVYAKIGKGDPNPVFYVVPTGDSEVENKLVQFLAIELENRSMCDYQEILKKR